MKVEETEGFPFTSFHDYRVSSSIGTVHQGVDPQIGMSLLLGGACGATRRVSGWILLSTPWILSFLFIVYSLVWSPRLLFGLPLLFVAFILTHPAIPLFMKLFRPLIFVGAVLILAACIYALINSIHPGLVVLGFNILGICAANITVTKIMVNGIALEEQEKMKYSFANYGDQMR